MTTSLLSISELYGGYANVPVLSGICLEVPEGSVVLDIPEALPMVAVDPGLLERGVANIVENAVKYNPDPERAPVLVAARLISGSF